MRHLALSDPKIRENSSAQGVKTIDPLYSIFRTIHEGIRKKFESKFHSKIDFYLILGHFSEIY